MTTLADSPRTVVNNYRPAVCPFCGGSRLRSMGTIHYPDPVQFSSLTVRLSKSASLVKCEICESRHVADGIDPDIASQLYREAASEERWSQSASFEREKTGEVLSFLGRYLKSRPRVLDVGCGAGSFLDYARSFGCSTHGVEPSRSARASAEARGHVVTASLDEIGGQTFDLVTAMDVVEHVYNPAEFLQRCAAALAPGGTMLVLTGDASSRSARLAGSRWWYSACPEHVAFPSLNFFRHLPGLAVSAVLRCFHGKWYLANSLAQRLRAALHIARGIYRGLPPIDRDHLIVALQRAAG